MEQETEIEQHLEEQNQELEVIMEALRQNPEDEELLQLQSELQASIDEFNKTLLEIKKSRLLDQIQLQQQHALNAEQRFHPGQICRFKHSNMKWYTGKVEEFTEAGSYLIKPSYPSSSAMLQSVVIDCKNMVEIDDDDEADFEFEVGSVVFALNYTSQLWEKAEVNQIDYSSGKIQVVYQKSGRRKWLDKSKLREGIDGTQQRLTDRSENSSCQSENEDYDEDDDDDDDDDCSTGMELDEEEDSNNNNGEQSGVEFHGGLGSVRFGSFKSLNFQKAVDQVIQTVDDEEDSKNTQLFADWEKHGKGVASKLMHKMGYEYGKGLGVKKQGRLEPVNAIMLPKNKGLGVVKEPGKQKKVKRRARGGEKARRKKRRMAAQELNDEETERVFNLGKQTGQTGVFAILDAAMAKHGSQQNLSSQMQQSEESQYFGKKAQNFVPDDRPTLIARQDRVGRLKSELVRLQLIADKNVKQKEIYNDIVRQISGIKMQIFKAGKDVASLEKAVNNKEKREEAFRF